MLNQPSPSHAAQGGKPPLKVVFLHKKGSPEDEALLRSLEGRIASEGFQVFVDRNQSMGVDWAREIEDRIRTADAIVPLLSANSLQSEMLVFQVEHAHEAAQQKGRPRLLPVRLKLEGSLPEPLAGIAAAAPELAWSGPNDNEPVAAALLGILKTLAPAQAPVRIVVSKGLRLMPRAGTGERPVLSATPLRVAPLPVPPPLEPVGGAVPLHSEFYLIRQADGELRTAMTRYDSIVLIKGARQMGKTSLLARGLQFARERGARVALTDFQKFNAANLETVSHFYLSLAESLAEQLDLVVLPSDVWDERRGANVNFERYIRREVLAKINAPLVWGLDEVDRLFACSFGSEVFGLFRSWHNERALDPSGPWSGLTLAIAYATEAHLFITDMNQSPFNIGTRIVLEDFTPAQVQELNKRHGSPLKSQEEQDRFIHLLGGHPFLVRRALHEMASAKIDIGTFESQAGREEGIFGDHLRRILVLLAKDSALTEVVRGILRGHPCPTPESFYRLRSAGVMTGTSQNDVHPRCKLYADYLARHLL